MVLPKYNVKANENFTRFQFISKGYNGEVHKRIEFQITANPDVYNLAFGDEDSITKDINDTAVTNNGDTEKVLATVVAAVYIFFDHYPAAYVYATGSTEARTRLYRMGITKYYKQMQKDFYLYGHKGDDFPEFVLNETYHGFLAQRKFV